MSDWRWAEGSHGGTRRCPAPLLMYTEAQGLKPTTKWSLCEYTLYVITCANKLPLYKWDAYSLVNLRYPTPASGIGSHIRECYLTWHVRKMCCTEAIRRMCDIILDIPSRCQLSKCKVLLMHTSVHRRGEISQHGEVRLYMSQRLNEILFEYNYMICIDFFINEMRIAQHACETSVCGVVL